MVQDGYMDEKSLINFSSQKHNINISKEYPYNFNKLFCVALFNIRDSFSIYNEENPDTLMKIRAKYGKKKLNRALTFFY